MRCKKTCSSNQSQRGIDFKVVFRLLPPDFSSFGMYQMHQIDFDHSSTDHCVDTFNSMFLNLVNAHAPQVTRRVKKPTQPKWMTSDILRAMHERDNAQKMGKEIEYKQFRNHTTQLIKTTESNHYKESIQTCKNNPRMLSNIFKELSHETSDDNTPSYLDFQNKTVTKDSDIAKAFNEHFTSLAGTYLESVDNPPPGMSEQHNFILCQEICSEPTSTRQYLHNPTNQRRMGPKNINQLRQTQSHRARQYICKSTESNCPLHCKSN